MMWTTRLHRWPTTNIYARAAVIVLTDDLGFTELILRLGKGIEASFMPLRSP